MNKHLFTLAFALGAAAIAWVGFGFLGTSHLLALLVTVTIAAVYGMGAMELQRFRKATATLTAALGALPDSMPNLGGWLGSLHVTLQNPVRLRVEGERVVCGGSKQGGRIAPLDKHRGGVCILLAGQLRMRHRTPKDLQQIGSRWIREIGRVSREQLQHRYQRVGMRVWTRLVGLCR